MSGWSERCCRCDRLKLGCRLPPQAGGRIMGAGNTQKLCGDVEPSSRVDDLLPDQGACPCLLDWKERITKLATQ